MPNENTESQTALNKLGQRLREGWARRHPTREKDLDTVRAAVRDQWEQDQEAVRKKPAGPSPAKSPQRKPQEPDQGR